MGIWTKGGQIDCMTIPVLAKMQKWYEGNSGRGIATNSPPERG